MHKAGSHHHHLGSKTLHHAKEILTLWQSLPTLPLASFPMDLPRMGISVSAATHYVAF